MVLRVMSEEEKEVGDGFVLWVMSDGEWEMTDGRCVVGGTAEVW